MRAIRGVFVATILSLGTKAERTWEEASGLAKDFVAKLSTEEQIGIVSGGYTQLPLACVGSVGGIPRLDFNGLCFSDGPAGLSRADGVSVFPSGITIASTWDRNLMYRRGVALGKEFRDKGAHVHLGPSTGPMGRHAQGGRNWEGFGPDPYLAGAATAATVKGVQSGGVQACTKHYIANEQEAQRTSTTDDDGNVIEAISSNLDDRTLHELYLWPFAEAVRANTSCIMCAYNRVDGTYACENNNTLSTILKSELDFPGYIVSDWYATHSTAPSANAGLDLEMPGNTSTLAGSSYFGAALLDAVVDGNSINHSSNTVTQGRLIEMAERVMRPYFLLGQDEDFPSLDPAAGASFLVYQYGHNPDLPIYGNFPQVPARDVRADHAKLIREIGSAGTVMLKNVNQTLPLQNFSEVGVFGNDAPRPTMGSVFLDYGEQHPAGFETGTFDIGGGSGTVRHNHLVAPLDAIIDWVEGGYGGRVQYITENTPGLLNQDKPFRSIYPVPDVCLLFLKTYASEGLDRPHLDLDWEATQVVEATTAMCPNTVVVVHGPGVVLMPWADNENVTAILSAHYPGEETGNSIVDVLWGVSEPSGRLPYTIPKTATEYGPAIVNLTEPVTDPYAWQADFFEGQMIDYRHFDYQDLEPLYEFGFGLSYSEFEMGALHVQVDDPDLSSVADRSRGTSPGGLNDLWNQVATARVEVTNAGSRTSSTVVQLYVAFPKISTPEGTPVKVLRGFEKLNLEAGETASVVFSLARKDVSFWDVQAQDWFIPDGTFELAVGFSSRDITSTAECSFREA